LSPSLSPTPFCTLRATHKQLCQLAVKPEATAVLSNFESLSIKQLKNILKAKAASYDNKKKNAILNKMDTIAEKPALEKLVADHVKPSEVEALLSNSSKATAQVGSSSSAAGKNKNTTTSTSSKRNAPAQPTPSPDQLRQQAKMMRENPQMVRNAQASFANMTDEQIRSYADQLETVR
jgi:hypothetical protein